MGWSVVSKGGYYAYVQFPDGYFSQQSALGLQGNEKVGSEAVARFLAEKLGVICLPGSFFMPDLKDGVMWDEIERAGGGELRADRWLRSVIFTNLTCLLSRGVIKLTVRFAIANVDDEVVVSLEPRLKRLNELLGMPSN